MNAASDAPASSAHPDEPHRGGLAQRLNWLRAGVLGDVVGERQDLLMRLLEVALDAPEHRLHSLAARTVAFTQSLRLAALLPAIESIAETVAARLRLSRKHRDLLACLANRRPADVEAPKALAYHEGRECAVGRLLLAGADPAGLADWDIPQLPLKGGEIVQRGLAGADVSKTLRAVESRWIAEGFPPRDRVLALLEEELSNRTSS